MPKKSTTKSPQIARRSICEDGLVKPFPDAANFLGGIGRTKIFEMMRRGVLPTVRIDGGDRKIPKSALVEYADRVLVSREEFR